jgi:FAD/FMN-containing dehydrogenase
MKKKYFWIIGMISIMIFISIPSIHLLKTKWNETEINHSIPVGYTNDASFLNLTKVDTIIDVPTNNKAIISQLKKILTYANTNNLKISIAGARHSMGGHTMYPNGIVINMLPYKQMKLNTSGNVLTIGSGALWEDAILYLDKHNKSVSIMQAFSSFSIGGSLSVNGHGWQKNLPPISSSVISFSLMNYEGEIMNCSRNENSELFKLVLGGYGLFGIILDVKIKVVDNKALKYNYINLSTEKYIEYYNKFITKNNKTELVFGRLRISKKRFLEEATLNFFETTPQSPTPLKKNKSIESKRIVFRGSVDSEYGKRLRWDLETSANKISKNAIFSRNELLNDDVLLIENKDTTSTDILHEYFVPERNFNQFIQDIKPVLLKSDIDLLNITIRRVDEDTDSYMNYARESVYGFVILFNQKKTDQQENSMSLLTNQLVDISIKNKGTFYLPYRLHINKEKMRIVYPQSNDFFELKKKYDPKEIFSNKFYDHYK